MKEKKRIKTINRIKNLSIDLDVNLFDLIPLDITQELSPNYQRPQNTIGFKFDTSTNVVDSNRNKVVK